MLPRWPSGTVAVLVTQGDGPHAIPVSALIRAGDTRLLLGLGSRRGSLERLRGHPRVAVAVLAPGLAFTAHGTAEVLGEQISAGVRAVAVEVDAVKDHSRPTFAIESGVGWHWTDSDAAARDAEVRRALERIARG